MCKTQPSLRTKFAVDLSYILMTNMLSFSSVVIWCYFLKQPMENVVAVDILVCMWLERWIYKVILSYDRSSPHPGGTIGKELYRQRMQLYCVLAAVLRGYGAAVSTTMHSHFSLDSQATYAMDVIFLPAVYSLIRAAMLDIDTRSQRLLPPEQVSVESAVFTITDDDEDPASGTPPNGTPPPAEDDRTSSPRSISEFPDTYAGGETSLQHSDNTN